MRSLIQRHREPIFVGGLLAFSLAVYFIFAGRARPDAGVERLVLSGLAPAEKAIVLAVDETIDLWEGYVWLRGVRRHNGELLRNQFRLQAELAHQKELENENERLRKILNLSVPIAPAQKVVARVIAVGPGLIGSTLRIDKGTADGIRPYQPVMSPDGAVGSISKVWDGGADVQLLISPHSAVAALGQRTRGRSTVKGMGNQVRCKLEYALRTEGLKDGDLLVTAGGPPYNFPKGIPIGTAAAVHSSPTGMFVEADLVPSVDFSRLDEVIVVLSNPAEAAAAPPPATLGGGASAAPSAGAAAEPLPAEPR